MKGKWAELACANEVSWHFREHTKRWLTQYQHGSIAVQQVFEVFGSAELMVSGKGTESADSDAGAMFPRSERHKTQTMLTTNSFCLKSRGSQTINSASELSIQYSQLAAHGLTSFVITKLISYPPLYRPTCDAILGAYPPVATSHHGVNFAKIALTEGGRASIVKYIEGICSGEDGYVAALRHRRVDADGVFCRRTPGIVAIATSSIGKAHLSELHSRTTTWAHASYSFRSILCTFSQCKGLYPH